MEVYKVTTAHAQGEEQNSNNCACARGGVYGLLRTPYRIYFKYLQPTSYRIYFKN